MTSRADQGGGQYVHFERVQHHHYPGGTAKEVVIRMSPSKKL